MPDLLGELVVEFFTDQPLRAVVPSSVKELLVDVSDSAWRLRVSPLSLLSVISARAGAIVPALWEIPQSFACYYWYPFAGTTTGTTGVARSHVKIQGLIPKRVAKLT